MQTAAALSLTLVKRTSRAVLSRRSGVVIPVGFQSISKVRFIHWIGDHMISPPSPTLVRQLCKLDTPRIEALLKMEPPVTPEQAAMNKEKFDEWVRQSGEDELIVKKFEEWMLEHGRVYRDTQEHRERYLVFKQKYLFIEAHNSDRNNDFPVGLMPFSDIASFEVAKYLSPRGRKVYVT